MAVLPYAEQSDVLEKVYRFFNDSANPLPVVLMGPSGSGKTSLAWFVHKRAQQMAWNTLLFDPLEQDRIKEAVPRILADGKPLLVVVDNCHWWVLENPRYALEAQDLLEFFHQQSLKSGGRLRTLLAGQGMLPPGPESHKFMGRARLVELPPLRNETIFGILGASSLPSDCLTGLQGSPLAADLVKYLASRHGLGVVDVIRQLLAINPVPAKSSLQADTLWIPSAPVVEVVRKFNDDLLRHYAERPQDLYRLTPLEFEEFIGELWSRRGWTVELTKQTHDGGADIIAVRSDAGTPIKVVVEAKRFAPNRPVSISLVRQLTFVRDKFAASKAVLATTSYFTKDASAEVRHLVPHVIDLQDLWELQRWIQTVVPKR